MCSSDLYRHGPAGTRRKSSRTSGRAITAFHQPPTASHQPGFDTARRHTARRASISPDRCPRQLLPAPQFPHRTHSNHSVHTVLARTGWTGQPADHPQPRHRATPSTPARSSPLATTPTHHQLNTPGNHTTALPRRTAESGPAAGTTTRLADPQTTAGSAGTGWHRFPPLPPLHQPRCPASDHPPNPAQTANRTPRQPKFGPPKLQLRRILHALPAGICRTTGPVVRRHPGKTSKSAKTALPSVGIRGSHLEFRNQQH